ncbi:GntR family transcriptional regulator [Burkholderia stabilis]|uniref:GntR family transcriptional regulator n=1 Tax=Burkholderia stabilis TaxID=95485 RepID=UPI0016473753|nr:GntR family transcriptional regulator [Burkholderia stabilis]
MKSDNFFELYRPQVSENPVKHEYLKEILVAAIEGGYWQDGDKFPTEQEMAEAVPFSLGTIQKAVGSLVSEGFVQRKRGAGTFIIPREKRLGEPWIYQVLSSDGMRFIPMTSTVLRRIQVESDAPWAHWLSGDAGDCVIVRLDRKIVAEEYSFISQYFTDVTRFPYFMNASLDDLRSENFVKITKNIYKASASKVVHTVRTIVLPKNIASDLDVSNKTYGTHVEIMGSTSAGQPIFYQQLYLPAGGPRIYI